LDALCSVCKEKITVELLGRPPQSKKRKREGASDEDELICESEDEDM
jgi:hypothetical protein